MKKLLLVFGVLVTLTFCKKKETTDAIPVTGVTLSKTELSVFVDGSGGLVATIMPEDASNKNVTWSTDNPTVAAVDNEGKVSGISSGTAIITVTTVSGNKTARCTITVTTDFQRLTLPFDNGSVKAYSDAACNEEITNTAQIVKGTKVYLKVMVDNATIKNSDIDNGSLGNSGTTATVTMSSDKIIETQIDATGFTFTEQGTTATITGYTETLSQIAIPTHYNSKPVTVIGEEAFCDKTHLTRIIIPGAITEIGSRAFYGCNRLTGDIYIPSGVTKLEGGAFWECNSLTGTLTLPQGITWLSEGTFFGCSGLTGALTIPDRVTYIGDAVFVNCKGLTGKLTLSKDLTNIGAGTFYGCSGLTGSVSVPSGVTVIRSNAFASCSGLTEIKLENATPPILQTSAEGNNFDGVHASFQIKVPAAGVAAYKAAENWSIYAGKISGY